MKTLKTTDRQVSFTMLERVLASALLARQTQTSVTKLLERDATQDDMQALYSVLRKIRCSEETVKPFTRSFGGDKTLDMVALQASTSDLLTVTLDGMETRVFRTVISKWLSKDGALGDWDWAVPMIEKL